MFAILALVVVGFSFLTFLQFQAGEKAEAQRQAILALQSSGNAQDAAAARRAAQAIASVGELLKAERTVTQQIIRQEVRAGPTTTFTARATVTETKTVIRPPGPPGFVPSGCIEVAGIEVCRSDAAMGGLLLGMSLLGFVTIRRTF